MAQLLGTVEITLLILLVVVLAGPIIGAKLPFPASSPSSSSECSSGRSGSAGWAGWTLSSTSGRSGSCTSCSSPVSGSTSRRSTRAAPAPSVSGCCPSSSRSGSAWQQAWPTSRRGSSPPLSSGRCGLRTPWSPTPTFERPASRTRGPFVTPCRAVSSPTCWPCSSLPWPRPTQSSNRSTVPPRPRKLRLCRCG